MRDPIWFAAFERSMAEGLPPADAVDRASARLRSYLEERQEQAQSKDVENPPTGEPK